MSRLPLTVISGYLGAGKTTLINRLLAAEHGLRLMVLVNDFGAINIDAALLESAEEDTIALTNGCVCCTMGADLFMALGDALDRNPRPDHLIVEASGVADPAAIANAAKAEPDLAYAGIVTVVDARNAARLLDDPMIGAQVAGQIRAADLIVLTRAERPDPALSARLRALPAPAPVAAGELSLAELLFEIAPRPDRREPAPHPAHTGWSHESDAVLPRARLERALRDRPEGLYRLKGFVLTDAGPCEVQVVGRFVEIRPAEAATRTRLVGIGPAARLSRAEMDAWWASARHPPA